jgi:hypothetical protein
MTTPLDIIVQALKKSGVLGVGQSAQAEDINDAFLDLNDLLSQWSVERWLVYHLVTYSKVSTGAVSYTVGPGGDFDIPRPDRLESAYLRLIGVAPQTQVDYPLEIIQSREDYNLITIKTLGTFPTNIFYDSNYPLGSVFPWPVPQASIYSIFITVKQPLTAFTSLGQTISMPPEYVAALKWNLAVRLRPSYQLPVDKQISDVAAGSLSVLRGANAQIPSLIMPPDLVRNTGIYNIYSDLP